MHNTLHENDVQNGHDWAVIRLIFEMISLNLRPNKAFILVTDKLILGSFQLRLKRHLQGSARTSESSQVAQKASTD
ncbi:hypothetical protein TUA1478L_35480 [Lactiplantibacillus plantarum]